LPTTPQTRLRARSPLEPEFGKLRLDAIGQEQVEHGFFRDAQVYLHQGLLGTPSQGLGIVGRFAVGRGRMMTFVVIIG
jgi:hypothetical protein